MCPAEENTAQPQATINPDEFSRLRAEHAGLEAKLSELEGLRFPTDKEKAQMKLLKKEKLSLKEQIEKNQQPSN